MSNGNEKRWDAAWRAVCELGPADARWGLAMSAAENADDTPDDDWHDTAIASLEGLLADCGDDGIRAYFKALGIEG